MRTEQSTKNLYDVSKITEAEVGSVKHVEGNTRNSLQIVFCCLFFCVFFWFCFFVCFLWCQSLGDVSPSVCSLYFLFGLVC